MSRGFFRLLAVIAMLQNPGGVPLDNARADRGAAG